MVQVFSVVVTYKWGKGLADLGNDLDTGDEEMEGNIILENIYNSYHVPGTILSDFIHIYIYIYTHTYICIYIYTYTHTYINYLFQCSYQLYYLGTVIIFTLQMRKLQRNLRMDTQTTV